MKEKGAGGEGSKFSTVWCVALGKGRVVGVSVGGGFGNGVTDGMRSQRGEAQYLGKGWSSCSGWDKAQELGDRSGLG